MSDTGFYRSTLRKRLVTESDTNPLNSTVNPRGNPSQFVPPERAESNPTVSVSGFIDKTLYRGPGTCLQAQREWIEARNAGVIA